MLDTNLPLGWRSIQVFIRNQAPWPAWQCPKCFAVFAGPGRYLRGHEHAKKCEWPDRGRDLADRVMTAAEADKELGKRTNEELSTLLVNHVWPAFDMFSLESALVEQAIERLKLPHVA